MQLRINPKLTVYIIISNSLRGGAEEIVTLKTTQKTKIIICRHKTRHLGGSATASQSKL